MVKRVFYRQIYEKNQKKGKLVFTFKFLIFVFLFFVFCFGLLFIYYAKDLPLPEKFTEITPTLHTEIYDREGTTLLYKIYGEKKRTIVPLEVMPEYLKQAVVATEDANFYKHYGIDPKAIVRAILADLKLGKPAQGASTIPQQLIRSSFLTTEKTPKRKIREIVLTIKLEQKYSKDEILEFYLNEVPFGSNTYGVEEASQTFFAKTVSEISLSEAALLTSLIRAPSYLSPYGEHKDRLLIRKNYVLDRLVKEDYISQEKATTVKEEEIKFTEILTPIKAPHFALFVKKYLMEKYGQDFLEQKGLKVYTTLDWQIQQQAEESVTRGALVNEEYNAYNASLVALNPKTGEILAMVGSKDWYSLDSYPKSCSTVKQDCLFTPKFNIVTSGKRQPGSAFKPFAYVQAFKKGYGPDTMLWDTQTNFGVWGAEPYIPENYDEKFRGPIDFRTSLAQSINVPSVKVLYLAGLKETIDLTKTLGITTLNESPSYYGLSLVLGGGEVKLLDMVSAYGVFATEGFKVPPVSILKIEDSDGVIIEENKKIPKRILDIQTCRLINDVLSDNQARTPMFGQYSPLYLKNFSTAAKTGTTQEYKDAWTIGYTPSIVCGVWVGNNNAAPMSKKPAVTLAGPIWRDFMEQTLTNYPKENFKKPEVVNPSPFLEEMKKELYTNPHSCLYYINEGKDDPQLPLWEKGITDWLLEQKDK